MKKYMKLALASKRKKVVTAGRSPKTAAQKSLADYLMVCLLTSISDSLCRYFS